MTLFIGFLSLFSFFNHPDSINNANFEETNYGLFKKIDNLTSADYTHLLDSLKNFGTTDFFLLRMS